MRKTLLAALVLGLVAGPAAAQYDPMASRAENQVNSLNRSMSAQEQNRAATQQNQFEVNSLRNTLSRPVPPPIGTQAAPGLPVRR